MLVCCSKLKKKVTNCNRNTTKALYLYTNGQGRGMRYHSQIPIFILNSRPDKKLVVNQNTRKLEIFVRRILKLEWFLKYTTSHNSNRWLYLMQDLDNLLSLLFLSLMRSRQILTNTLIGASHNHAEKSRVHFTTWPWHVLDASVGCL